MDEQWIDIGWHFLQRSRKCIVDEIALHDSIHVTNTWKHNNNQSNASEKKIDLKQQYFLSCFVNNSYFYQKSFSKFSLTL